MSDPHSNLTVQSVFAPLLGLYVWQVSQGYGTFLTLEFGAPHLDIREPRTASPATSARLKRALARRLAVIRGDWHLFVEFARWRLASSYGQASSEGPKRAWQAIMEDLSGQRLTSAESSGSGHLTLRFDLGAALEIAPDPDIDNDVWTLHRWHGDIVGCTPAGRLQVERPQRPAQI